MTAEQQWPYGSSALFEVMVYSDAGQHTYVLDLVSLLTFMAHAGVLTDSFAYDDLGKIIGGETITHGLDDGGSMEICILCGPPTQSGLN